MKEYTVKLASSSLSAGYGGKDVLKDIDITFSEGECVVLIGANGSGKSTLIKSIAGQLAPSAGTVMLSGKDMKLVPPSERAKEMSLLLTGRTDTDYITCREAASRGRYPYTGLLGILSEKDKKAVDDALGRMNALEFADRPFAGVSDGQRQRVLLARALCQEPEILILDEPASFLDIRYQLELADNLTRLAHEDGITVIVSFHELELARRTADRLICIKDGRVVRIGTPGEIFSENYPRELFDIPDDLYDAFYPGPGEKKEEKENAAGYRIAPGGKRLRRGFTTGTCAALAASGAAGRLLRGRWPDKVSLLTPGNVRIEVPLEEKEDGRDFASCGVKKDAGDDIDITDGMIIKAKVSLCDEKGIFIEGGEGIGRVTKPGLDRSPGEAAINTVPRKMIEESVSSVCEETEYVGGLKVVISAPGGEKAAERTFNPDLGIEGGISILGTSGIVEPMSLKALADTIRTELKQKYETGERRVILTPGNYGLEFIRKNRLDRSGAAVVRCSNFIGESLDAAAAYGYEEVLITGHSGKIVKLAGGIMNTHSGQADCRRELFTAYAALCGASKETCEELMDCATSDACIEVLLREGLEEKVTEKIMEAVQKNISARAPGIRTGAVMFSDKTGMSWYTDEAVKILDKWDNTNV